MTSALSRAPTTRCTRSCSAHGSVGSSASSGGTVNKRDLGKVRRAFGRKVAQPRVIAVAEADAVGFLDQFDAVEDSAADVGGSLERVAAGSGDDERLLAWLQTAGEPLVAVVSEQAAADRGHGDVGDVEIDECVVRDRLPPDARPRRRCPCFRRPC